MVKEYIYKYFRNDFLIKKICIIYYGVIEIRIKRFKL